MKQLKKSASQAQKERAALLKAWICEILSCTEEQYGEFVYAEGLKYLRYFLPDDQDGRRMLSRARVFWNWWKNHWTNRDGSFKQLFESFPIPDDRDVRIQLYLNYHDGKQLAENMHPQSIVLEESYNEMIHELLVKEAV